MYTTVASAARTYDPYGVVTFTSGTSQTDYGFTGESYGDSTQLLYLRARYYNPADGRFTSRDIWAGDMNHPLSYNKWQYVSGNPTNYTDPTGFKECAEDVRFCQIVEDGPYKGFFIDTSHWGGGKQQSYTIKDALNRLRGVPIPLGKFSTNEILTLGNPDGPHISIPYNRTYYTNIPSNISDNTLEQMTLGILMDFEVGLEDFEGPDPACSLTKDGNIEIIDHRCSSFSNEDLPSVYLGYVAYRTQMSLRDILEKFVGTNVEEATEGMEQKEYPTDIAKRFFEARNHCFTPRILDPITNQFTNVSWPPGIPLYSFIGPGMYWSRSLSELIPSIPTPPQNPAQTPSP